MIALILSLCLQELEIQRLIGQLGDDDIERRESASRGLERLGNRAVPALVRALEIPDEEVRVRAGAILEAACRRTQTPTLQLTLGEPKEDSDGIVTVKLGLKNDGKGPALVRRADLWIAGLLEERPDPKPFLYLTPAESVELEVRGRRALQKKKLKEVYLPQLKLGKDLQEVKVIRLKVATAEDMADLIRDLFTPERGSPPGSLEIAVDRRTNSVVVRANRDDLEMVDKLIEQLDRDP